MPTNLYGLIEQRPDSPNLGRPFYIGIGTARRPRTHFAHARSTKKHPNARMQEIFEAHFALGVEPAIRIIGTFPTAQRAWVAEKKAIAQYGRIGIDPNGTLCNLSAGGEGVDSETMRATWKDPNMRASRTNGMRGKKKTKTPESTAARQANARKPRSAEALALQRAAAERNWASPEFRVERSASQAAAWEDPEKRANMLAGRSEGIAQSWENTETREARTAAIGDAVSAKWEDPDYAERTRAGLRDAWADPAKKAARVAKMLASRAANGAKQSPEGTAKHSKVMTAVNAALTTEDRSAIQSKSWEDPSVRANRTAALKASAQDPALKAARVERMLAGKRRKAALKAMGNGEHQT